MLFVYINVGNSFGGEIAIMGFQRVGWPQTKDRLGCFIAAGKTGEL